MGSKGKAITKPKINPNLLRKEIVNWTFIGDVNKYKSGYRFRIKLEFADGSSKPIQIGGLKTKKEAKNRRDSVMGQLHVHTFVPFQYTVKEFFDYWLYYHMIDDKKITYNTFVAYRNNIYNYLLKSWGEETFIEKITKQNILDVITLFQSPSAKLKICSLIDTSFQYAMANNILSTNPTYGVSRLIKNSLKAEKKNKILSIDDCDSIPEEKRVLSADEAARILYICKNDEPEVYMPILFTITCGLRISEALAVRFDDIDFGNKIVKVSGQIGRDMQSTGLEEQEVVLQHIAPKSKNGYRKIPLAAFVIDEIHIARRRYEYKMLINPSFKDGDYICCRDTGLPYNRSNVYNSFHRVINKANVGDIKWHSMRRSYSTLLASEGINMKAISVCMGHFSEEFTKTIYVSRPTLPFMDTSKYLFSFLTVVMSSEEDFKSVHTLKVASYLE